MNGVKSNTKKPDLEQVKQVFTEKYNAEYANKTLNTVKLFIYYNNHREKFASSIVKYTEICLDMIDLKTLNTNAGYVLQFSRDKKELEMALEWSRSIVKEEPKNTEYSKTRDTLIEKLKVLENEKNINSNTDRICFNC
jgi:hypothetical protein